MRSWGALIGVLISLVLPGLSAAEEGKPNRDETVKQLTAAYEKLESYVAIYHLQGPTKTAEITLAMDAVSGLGVLHLVGTKDGHRSELRQWSTRDGKVYSDDGSSLKRMDAYMAGYHIFKELGLLAKGPDPMDGVNILPMMVPSVIVEESSLSFGLNMGMRNRPTWIEWIEGGPLKGTDGTTVTFSTVSHGDLGISLESGLVVRQSTAGDDGGISLLELKDVQLNPGAGVVAELTTDWKTDGAESMDGVMAASGRKMFFQSMIEAVEKGEMKLADLQERLLDKSETIETFADGCVVEKKGSLAESGRWGKVANETTMRQFWIKAVPDAEKEDDRAFSAYMADEENRRKLRELIVEVLLDGEDLDILWSNLTIEIFGKGEAGNPKLKTTNDDGAAAKKAIEASLGRAYLSVVLDREITKYWERR